MIDVETPALLLYRDVMEQNLKSMAARAKKLGVSLRPHIKTHKCLELGRRQLAYGAQGITVSTLSEAQSFARGGFTDLTWAFPLDPSHIPHVQRIARDGVTLRVMLDDLDTAKALSGTGMHVWLKVDCGYHRAGVDPSSRYGLDVARELGAERGVTFDGEGAQRDGDARVAQGGLRLPSCRRRSIVALRPRCSSRARCRARGHL